MSFVPKGIIPAMITPLTQDYKVNEQALRKLIDYLIVNGSHGIFVAGTAGEFYGFTPEEKREMIGITVDQAKGRVPVYAGTGSVTTRESVLVTQIAEEAGADAVSVLTPFFLKPNQDELYKHYKDIAKSTKLPVLLYNNVPKTGVNIAVETVKKLADIQNVVGVKDSSGDFTLTSEYIRNTKGKDFYVLAGRDTLIHACLCYGGNGAIAACANLAPRLMADIYDKFMAGDIAGSLEAQYKVAPIRMSFTLGSFPTVLKEGLELLGIEAGPSAAPIGTMTKEEKRQLKDMLTEVGVLK